jgi:hypothetical protein
MVMGEARGVHYAVEVPVSHRSSLLLRPSE